MIFRGILRLSRKLHSANARLCHTSELKWTSPEFQKYLSNLKTIVDENNFESLGKVSGLNKQRLMRVNEAYESALTMAEEIASLEALKKEMRETGEKEMADMAEKDIKDYGRRIQEQIRNMEPDLLPFETSDTMEVMMEFTAGVGGQEAMLFNKDLFEMYVAYSRYKGWQAQVMDFDGSDTGGLRHGSITVAGPDCGKILKFEGGVHRVQRVPKTEKAGRIHTSTATLAVYPCPQEVDVVIDAKDIAMKTKRAGGPGGQHVNKTESAVQIQHIPTGIMVESDTERSQLQNKELAMKKLRARLFDLRISEETNKVQQERKLQVGSAGRSEKIRTYNFVQDRVTDHRIPVTLHNLVDFLNGGPQLDELIMQLQDVYRQDRVRQLIKSMAYI